MSVSLEIIAFKEQPYENNEAVVFGHEGGNIGRLPDCDLVLPDEEKLVSRHHAEIVYQNGAYLLKDNSLGGTYIDDNPTPLNYESILLHDGMRLRMGDYQILVKILPENDAAIVSSYDELNVNANPFVEPVLLDSKENNEILHQSETKQDDSVLSPFADESIHELLSENPKTTDSYSEVSSNISSLHDSFIPPTPAEKIQTNNEIPEDFDFSMLINNQESDPLDNLLSEKTMNASSPLKKGDDILQSLSKPLQTEVKESVLETDEKKVSEQAESLYVAFLQGAQLQQNGQVDTFSQFERMRRIGAMFRQFVESMTSVLRSRAEFKSLFRVTVTTIKRTDNNPLKFSVTTDEALRHLLEDGQDGFKTSVEAIEEGFQDLLNHQLAMQAGIQASLQELLNQFDPAKIEAQFSEGMVLNKKSKCWDRFCEIYTQLAEQAVDDFYGETFADAYDRQMKQISRQSKDNK